MSGETADRIAALDQGAGAVPALAPEVQIPSAPLAESAQVADAVNPLLASQSVAERPARLEPQPLQLRDTAVETASALSVQPETAKPAGTPVQVATRLEPELLGPAVQPLDTMAGPITVLPAEPEPLQAATRLEPELLGPAVQPLDTMAGPITVLPAEPEPVQAATRLEPELLGPAVQPLDAGASPVSILPAEPETAAPVQRPIETALLVPARPGSTLGTAVDKPSDRYRRIVDFIRRYSGGDCFIALPAMNFDGAVTFQTFGRDKAREDLFRQAVFDLDGLRAEISSGDVADPQCQALAFARSAKRYPGFSLMIDLDEADVASGTRLSGLSSTSNGRDVICSWLTTRAGSNRLDLVFWPQATGLDHSF